MNCKQAQRLIPLWAGDDLAPSEQRAVEAHLRHCAACRELSDAHRHCQELLGVLAAEAPPPGESLWPNVQQGLVLQHHVATRTQRWLWALAAALLLAWTATWVVWSPTSSSPPLATTPPAPVQDIYWISLSNRQMSEPLPDLPVFETFFDEERPTYPLHKAYPADHRRPY